MMPRMGNVYLDHPESRRWIAAATFLYLVRVHGGDVEVDEEAQRVRLLNRLKVEPYLPGVRVFFAAMSGDLVLAIRRGW